MELYVAGQWEFCVEGGKAGAALTSFEETKHYLYTNIETPSERLEQAVLRLDKRELLCLAASILFFNLQLLKPCTHLRSCSSTAPNPSSNCSILLLLAASAIAT
jgi:hypothetical protein